MLADVPTDEYVDVLDARAEEALWTAHIGQPPVDALALSRGLGLLVTSDGALSCRARFVRLSSYDARPAGVGTIVVGPSDRPEREQWAVAHEVGESLAYQVFERLGLRPEDAPPYARETVANHLASCLLLPRQWFANDGRAVDWDLYAMKERYATASHELIARRMLEMPAPVVITVCDQGRITWRRSNISARPPRPLPEEREVWQRAHVTGLPAAKAIDPEATGLERVRCWAVHEPDWKREIMRSEIAE
jgi:hypothetical protein